MTANRDKRNTAKLLKTLGGDAKGKKGPPSCLDEASEDEGAISMAEILQELRELRKENQEAFTDTKASLSRLETSVSDLKQRMEKLERRTEDAETRVGAVEDTGQRHERVLRHLVRREAALANICEDLQNRMRRNNLRIYQVAEGSEKNGMVEFVKQLINTTLQLPPEINIQIERAHRALGLKPAASAPPRSIIVRFLDYTVKEAVLRQAWTQKRVTFQGKVIYFDQDYSPEVQRKRARVRGVIKQLKDKGIQARCRFPAQLKISLDTGEKTFPTLIEAVPTLGELGITVQVSDREKMERELARETWRTQESGRRGKRDASLSDADLRFFLRE